MRRRCFWILSVLLVVAGASLAVASIAAPSRHTLASEEGDREATTAGACGVERWAVKTGMDADAKNVDLNKTVPTNIFHLRSLPSPSSIPPTSRIAPTENTVFTLTATLARFKIEADSDYHLVLTDKGGRTMIAEIPWPSCVGSTSPWLPKIRYTRRVFDARYHVTGSWQRVNQPVTITGVGFFDFKHGQSGVAPNGIELHSVLNIRWGSSSSNPPGPPVSPPPTAAPPRSSGSFSVHVSLSPNPVHYGQHATVTAVTSPGATCTASVVYSTGRRPVSFNGSAEMAGGNGTVNWSWHMESKGSSGTATVQCSLGGKSASASATFVIG